jgi:hypothetical protein
MAVPVGTMALERTMKRLFIAVTALWLGVLGCSSSPKVQDHTDDGDYKPPPKGDGGVTTDEPPLVDGPPCKPKTCDELGFDCGKAANGCGKLIDCGKCSSGSACGLNEHNVCTVIDTLCKPVPKAEACDGKECGVEGDGCGGSYECGSCKNGEVCGVLKAFRCDKPVVDNPESCPAQIDSCAAADAECGVVGNGCGGLIDCDEETGGCEEGSLCGLGGAQKCGAIDACAPLTKADACDGVCGQVSNGCGVEVNDGLINCPACPDGQACGASGVPNVCGDASNACEPMPKAQACEDRECGAASDGCTGSVSCGTCASGTQCNDGICTPLCHEVAKADACKSKECGQVSDGCGGSYACGTCADGEACGLLAPFQCDIIPPSECVPRTESEGCNGKECGKVYDGCGTAAKNVIDCSSVNGGCDTDDYCGVQEPFQCDPLPMPTCTATSCAELGWECGIAVDACGNTFDCTDEGLTCDTSVETCMGGIDGPAHCSTGFEGGPGSNCDVCSSIANCDDEAQPTRLTGRVITAGSNDADTVDQIGIPNAFVYILRNDDESELPDIPAGIPEDSTSCDRCDDQTLGPVLASTVTDALGDYTLEGNIPVGKEFVLVVKIGKFRRAVKYTVPADAACKTTAVDHLSTRLPRTRTDGLAAHIPHIAISTGQADAMECVFRAMGISDSEFGLPGSAGDGATPIHMYRANGASMAQGNDPDSDLYTDLSRMLSYDLVVFACLGENADRDAGFSDPNIREYVNRGGRLFASHYSYTWLRNNGTSAYDSSDPIATGLKPAASWISEASLPATGTGIVSVGRPRANASKIQDFADWLVDEGAATKVGSAYQFTIQDPRDLAASVGTGSEEYVYRDLGGGSTSVQQFAFNTPYGAPQDAICGRVAYSAFHVFGGGNDQVTFPDHCNANLSAQEQVLLYMLFDLASCVSTGEPEPPKCNAVTDCTGRCGNLADGCGGVLECSCSGAELCLAGGICGKPECLKTTCEAEGATCGTIADGCGGKLDCGDCPSGQVCGLDTPNQCTITCTPNDKAVACKNKCGFVSDGCGGVHECDGCDGSASCNSGACEVAECAAQACPDSAECGRVSDGCDGFVECGECTPPLACGGGGVPNKCGRPDCPALSCGDLGAECGWIGDGCGAAVDCGPCPSGQVCGTDGHPNKCSGCEPLTCEGEDAECGAIGNGCGDSVDCGPCPKGQVCGVREPNKCGDPGECVPLTCKQADAECGLIGDGCGKTVDCGACPPDELCGAKEPFKCGPPPSCKKATCDGVGAECGAIGDGCGGLVDCGPCPAGASCGVNNPNQCTLVRPSH